MSTCTTAMAQFQVGIEVGFSITKRDPWGNIAAFLRTIPTLDAAEFTGLTNLKSDQLWARRSLEFGYAFLKRDDRKLFWKTLESERAFFAELNGYRLLSPFFRNDQLQRPVGIDVLRLRIFYEYLEGLTLWELRFPYTVAAVRNITEEANDRQNALHVILDVEVRRHEEMLKAYYQSTLFTAQNAISPQDKETSLLNHLLEKHISEYKTLLATCYPLGLPIIDCTVDEYLSYCFVINEDEYGSLDTCLLAASKTISSSTLNSAILAAGLGEAASSNVILDAAEIRTRFHFIDFEVGGLQNPFVDMSRAIYEDCFFTACVFESLVELKEESRTTEPDCGFRIAVRISHETRQIHITHNYWTQLKAPCWDVAGINIFGYKFFNVVLPLVNHLESLHGKGTTNWEQLLGQSLFVWSARRSAARGPHHSSFFSLNTCIGMELFRFSHWLDVAFKPAIEKLGIEKQLHKSFTS